MKEQLRRGIRNQRLCIDMANAFLNVGHECNEQDRKAQEADLLFGSDAFYAFPAIVNTAFACELYLKALIAKTQGSHVMGHSLSDLFERLTEEDRLALREEYASRSQYSMEIDEVLRIHSKSFEDWRYAYENGKEEIEAYPDNLITAASVIKEYLQRKEGRK